MASNASLSYLRFLSIAYLHKLFELQFSNKVGLGLAGIQVGQPPEIPQFIVVDVRAIFLRKQICKNPIPPASGHNDRRYRFLLKRFLKTPPPRSSAYPSITCRIAVQSSLSPIRAFRAAFENHTVLKTRVALRPCRTLLPPCLHVAELVQLGVNQRLSRLGSNEEIHTILNELL